MLRHGGDIQDPGRPGIHDAGSPGGRCGHVGQDSKPGTRRVLHSYTEVALMLGVSTRTVQRLVDNGDLPKHEVLRKIPATAVKRFLQRVSYGKKDKIRGNDT